MPLSPQQLETFLWEQPRVCEARGLATWQGFFALGRRYRHLPLGPYGEAQQVSVRFSSVNNCYYVQLLISAIGTIGPGTYFKAKRQLSALKQLLERTLRTDGLEASIYLDCVLVGRDVAKTGDFVYGLNLDASCYVFTYSYDAGGIRFQPVPRTWNRQLSREHEAGLHELATDLRAERLDALSISQAERTDALAGLTASVGELADLVVTPAGIAQQPRAVTPSHERRKPRRAAPLASPLFPLSALFQHDGQPVIWPGTVNLLHGATSTHKSRVAALLASIALATQAGHQLLADALGFTFHPAPGQQYRVLLVDTAHHPAYQLPPAVQGLLAQISYYPLAPELASLVLEPGTDRFAVLADWLATQRHHFTGHLLLVLDSLTDCRPLDYSLPAGVAQLHKLAQQYGATVLAVNYPRYQERATWGRAATVLQFATGRGPDAPGLQLRLVRRAPAAAPLTCYATYCPTAEGLVRVAHPLPARAA